MNSNSNFNSNSNSNSRQQHRTERFRDEVVSDSSAMDSTTNNQRNDLSSSSVNTMSLPEPLDDDANINMSSDLSSNIGSNINNTNNNAFNSNTNTNNGNWKTQVLAGFNSLRNSPSELYKVYALKFLDSYSYFSFSIIFTLFLSDDFGFSDIEAGTIYGAWGAMITVYGFCTGFLVDNFGVSKSLKLGYGLSLLARCGIFATTSRSVLLFHMYATLPLGNCLGIPVLMTGVRRYTHERNRGFAFGIFYVVMNIAALVSGPTVDVMTIWYKGGGDGDAAATAAAENNGEGASDPGTDDSAAAVKEWSLSSYRAIILTGIIANVVAFCITFTVREIKVEDPAARVKTTSTNMNNTNDDSGGDSDSDSSNNTSRRRPSASIHNKGEQEVTAYSNNNNNNSNSNNIVNNIGNHGSNEVTAFQPKTGTPLEILREISKSPSFRRYLVVILIMLNVRQIFRHLDSTWPKYMIREFGPDVPKGTIYAINPTLIIILVPIVSAMTAHIDPLVMIHIGSYVSAASVFFLALSTTIWSSCFFVFVLSLGEAIWSPRLNDYTVSVSEEGREGTYMALSSAPLFLAKLPVGILSGVLLQKYCPETLQEGEVRRSRVMWLIIGLLTATSPVVLTCCWKYVSKKHRRPNASDEFGDGVAYTELQTTNTSAPTTTTTTRPADAPRTQII